MDGLSQAAGRNRVWSTTVGPPFDIPPFLRNHDLRIAGGCLLPGNARASLCG
jgi:hypothetical protein